jgi:hypothetical protein
MAAQNQFSRALLQLSRSRPAFSACLICLPAILKKEKYANPKPIISGRNLGTSKPNRFRTNTAKINGTTIDRKATHAANRIRNA